MMTFVSHFSSYKYDFKNSCSRATTPLFQGNSNNNYHNNNNGNFQNTPNFSFYYCKCPCSFVISEFPFGECLIYIVELVFISSEVFGMVVKL